MGVQNSPRYLTAQLEHFSNAQWTRQDCLLHLAHNWFTLVSYKLFYILFNLFRTLPPRTSTMMLNWLTLDSGYRFVSSSLSWLYFVVSSKSLDFLFSSHGQLISITLTCLLVFSMIVASTLLAFTWVVSANNGTSQRAVACLFSYSGLGNWLIIIITIIIIISHKGL